MVQSMQNKPMEAPKHVILQLIREMMTNHDRLNPYLFDKDCKLEAVARRKLLGLAEFVKKSFFKSFPLLKICDITLNGSSCSYIYNHKTDIDLFLVTEPLFPQDIQLTEFALNNINIGMARLFSRPQFNRHPVDFGVLYKGNERVNPFNCYSVLNDCWILSPPIHQEFDFSPEELYEKYLVYRADLYSFSNSLEKTKSGFLTKKSQKLLRNHLIELQDKAFACKWYDEKHEYGEEYNLYRLLKKFKDWKYFREYLKASENGVIKENES